MIDQLRFCGPAKSVFLSVFYQKEKSHRLLYFLIFERIAGIRLSPKTNDGQVGLDSRSPVGELGLATASRFCLLAKYRSGVRFPHEPNYWLVSTFKYERVAGIEPASQPWEGRVLPLNHTRLRLASLDFGG